MTDYASRYFTEELKLHGDPWVIINKGIIAGSDDFDMLRELDSESDSPKSQSVASVLSTMSDPGRELNSLVSGILFSSIIVAVAVSCKAQLQHPASF